MLVEVLDTTNHLEMRRAKRNSSALICSYKGLHEELRLGSRINSTSILSLSLSLTPKSRLSTYKHVHAFGRYILLEMHFNSKCFRSCVVPMIPDAS